MLDPKLLRSDPESVAKQLARRGFALDTAQLLEYEERRKAIQMQTQEVQAERNAKSKAIGKAKAAGEDIAPLLKEVEGLGSLLKGKEDELAAALEDINTHHHGCAEHSARISTGRQG